MGGAFRITQGACWIYRIPPPPHTHTSLSAPCAGVGGGVLTDSMARQCLLRPSEEVFGETSLMIVVAVGSYTVPGYTWVDMI